MSFLEALMAKRQRSGHGVKQSSLPLLKGRSFKSGECPHFEGRFSSIPNTRPGEKGCNGELSDTHLRMGVMSVSPRQTHGWEKNHVNGRCLTAERSQGQRVDYTERMLSSVGKSSRSKTGTPVGFSRLRPERYVMTPIERERHEHVSKGQCTALTKRETMCKRKSLLGTYRCKIHTLSGAPKAR